MKFFLWGVLVMGATLAGVFFLRFWTLTRDRLFVLFALAFWVLAANWLGLAVTSSTSEFRLYFFALRLVAFGLIIVAILDKNRRGSSI